MREAPICTWPTWLLWKPEQAGAGREPVGAGRACRQGLKMQKPQAVWQVVAGDVKEIGGQWALEQGAHPDFSLGLQNGPK